MSTETAIHKADLILALDADGKPVEMHHALRLVRELREELAALRAQEPMAWAYWHRDDPDDSLVVTTTRWAPGTLHPNWQETKLYAAPAPSAVAKTDPFLNFNLTQAMALVESFGGLDCDMAVSWFPKGADVETGEPMPEGLYAYCYDYPEEGRQWLGDPMAEITAPATAPAAVPPEIDKSSRVLDGIRYSPNYVSGWNDCREAMLAAHAPAAVPDTLVGTLLKFNAWRKGEIHEWNVGTSGPDPQEITKAIDTACALLSAATAPAAVAEVGKLWSWLRNVMQQGEVIAKDHADATNHDGYERHSARLDAAASERADELLAMLAGAPSATQEGK